MINNKRIGALVATTALVVVLTANPPAGAATGDLDGNGHPNVGVMLVATASFSSTAAAS